MTKWQLFTALTAQAGMPDNQITVNGVKLLVNGIRKEDGSCNSFLVSGFSLVTFQKVEVYVRTID